MPIIKIADLLRAELPLTVERLRADLANPAAVPATEAALRRVLEALDTFDRTHESLDRDPHLSDAGKRSALQAARTVALGAIEAWKAEHVGPVQTEADRLAAALVQPPAPKDASERLLVYLQQQELRVGLRDLSAVERAAVYADAGDELALAMEAAPAVLTRLTPTSMPTLRPFLDAAQVEGRQLARVEREKPTEVAALRDTQRLARLYTSTVASAQTALAAALPDEGPPVPAPGVDPLAEKTKVPVAQSRSEIEQLLARSGAKQYGTATDYDLRQARVQFRLHDRIVRFVISLPDAKKFGRGARLEQAERQKWRALLLVIKAKLESVENSIETFEEAFLANVVLPNDRTVAEMTAPLIASAYKDGTMPRQLTDDSGWGPPPEVSSV
jgi:hypothetical protein